jgi:hypothetical protein
LAFNEAAATQFFEKSDVLRCIARQGQQAAETIRLLPRHRCERPRDNRTDDKHD